MKAKNDALALDSYGTRLWRRKKVNKALSVYAKSEVANIATVLFVLTDLVCLYTAFNTVQTESAVLIALITIACGICLDVPMACAGVALKQYHEGLKDKKSTMLVMVLATTTFLVTFAFSFWFRLETGDLTFDLSSGSTMVDSLATSGTETVNNEGNNAVLVASIFSAVIPFATSIGSFVINYFSFNPIEQMMAKNDEAIITLDSNAIELKQGLEEAKYIEEYKRYLLDREYDMYKQFCEAAEAQGLVLKQAARFVVMEKLQNPDDISVVTESGHNINKQTSNTIDNDFKSTGVLND